jgi:hypothetical protein
VMRPQIAYTDYSGPTTRHISGRRRSVRIVGNRG